MTYQGVSKGLKFVLGAELLEIAALLLFGFVSAMNFSLALDLILGILCICMLLVTLFLHIKGLSMAAASDSGFRSALEANVMLLIIEAVYVLFNVLARWVPVFANLNRFGSFISICSLIASILIVAAIKSLFTRVGETGGARLATTVIAINVISTVLSLALNVFSIAMYNDLGEKALLISSLAVLALTLVNLVLYLVLLRKAINKFA